MRTNLAVTILVGTAVVVGAVVGLAEDSSWPVLAGAAAVLIAAAVVVTRAALWYADDRDEPPAPGSI